MKAKTQAFKEFVRHPFAWPGGYPLFAIMDDGACICRECAKSEAKQIIRSTRDHARDGWECIGVDVNWEDTDSYCAHCNKPIESAYGGE
jgi:hypothetical protein